MNKDKYMEIIEKIDNALLFYENNLLESTKFYLNFTNGNSISIKYGQNNIAHLLGINTNYLMSTGIFDGNSYDILCEMVSNPNKLMRQIDAGHIPESIVFSDFIEEKLENFRKVCGVNIFDIEFIVNYKKERNLMSAEPLDDGIYIGYSDGLNLSIVGYKQNESNKTYFPHTSLLFKEDSLEADKFLTRLLKNQETTIIETMKKNTITNYYDIDRKTYYYNHREKVNKLRACKRYSEMYNASSNTINSNLYFVEKVINANEDNYSFNEILQEVSSKIKDKKMIDISQLKAKYNYMDDNIVSIVSAHNDSLVKTSSSDNFSYKDLITSLENCKKELEDKNALILKLEDKNNKLTAYNDSLKLENKEYQEREEQIVKILKNTK